MQRHGTREICVEGAGDSPEPLSDMRNEVAPDPPAVPEPEIVTEPGEEVVRYFGAWEAPPNPFTESQTAGWYWRNVASLGAWTGPTKRREVAIRNALDNRAPVRWF